MKYDVPFYSNTADDTHCMQASLKMILKHFHPEKEFSWAELDEITEKVPDKWTWPFASYLWLIKNGFSVTVVQLFDIERFVLEGKAYLTEFAGEEVADAQDINSDIKTARVSAKQFLESHTPEKRSPNISDIKAFLEQGCLVTCAINSFKLDNKTGYAGHSVLVIGYSNDGLYLHDPGLPPYPDRFVMNKEFEAAWAYPEESVKTLTAYKLL